MFHLEWFCLMPVHTCVDKCAWNGGYIYIRGTFFFKAAPLLEFVYLVFTRMPGGVTVGDSGLCCCVPCPSSAIISLRLVILHKRSGPHSVWECLNPCSVSSPLMAFPVLGCYGASLCINANQQETKQPNDVLEESETEDRVIVSEHSFVWRI